MAASRFPTTLYRSSSYLESAGLVIFHRPTQRIALLNNLRKNEWMLAKGRRNLQEPRHVAALREAGEETGLRCRLMPCTFASRVPPKVETGNTPDEARTYERVEGEAFMLMVRELPSREGRKEVKLIWWFIGEVDEELGGGQRLEGVQGEDMFELGWFGYEAALEKLTFQDDREVVRRAIEIVEETFGP